MASGLGIALQLAGTAAIVAGLGVATGGLGFALVGAGILAVGAGSALAAQAAQPEPISQVQRQLATTSDAESPWEWVYGEAVKGSAMVWQGVGGSDDELNGADFVVACHPCSELLGIQVGEWYFPIVTDPAGTATANTRGLILNNPQLTSAFPTDWYVPVAQSDGSGGIIDDHANNSKWWRRPQDDKNTGDFPHIGVKWNPGNQVATDAHMTTRFGVKYSSKARKFIGHSVAHIITRVNDELGTASWQQVLFHVRGKSDILDHTGANPAYRTNAAYIFADICREWLGIPVTDIVGVNPGQTLQGVAAECDDTTWSGSGGTTKRYDFHGVFRDDMEPIDAMKAICQHMCGDYSERGDKIALFTGTVKPVWADGPLTYDDVADVGGSAAITIIPPDEDGWFNTLVPHFTVQRTDNEDGQKQLYGRMEPTKHDVTAAAYVTEDQSVTLRQDIKFPHCITARQAKHRAWIVLKQARLGASMEVTLKKRASVLEKGDVVACNFPDFFPNGTKFQVASKQMILGPDTFAVRIGLVRYEDAIYTPDTVPTEDAIGVVGKRRSSLMPVITGLAAEVLEAWVHPDGHIVCNVSVTWTLVPNFLVRSAGDVRIAWKKQSQSRWKATTVPGDEIETELSGLMQGVAYHIKARAEGAPTAGRTGKPKGNWSTVLSFTPESGFSALPGAPGSAVLGENAISNGNFEGGVDENGVPVGYEYQVTSPAVFDLNATGGKFGPHRLRLIMNGSTDDQYFRTEGEGPFGGLIPVEPGQRWELVWWIDSNIDLLDDDPVNEILQLQFYDQNATFIVTEEVTRRTVTFSDNGTWYRLRGTHTVPATVSFMRPQFRIDPTGLTSIQTFIQSDGLKAKQVRGGTSEILTTTKTLNAAPGTGVGDVWTDCRSITGATPGDPVRLVAQFEARVGDAGSSGSAQQLEVRIVRTNTDGSNLQVISVGELRGDTVAIGTAFGPWFTVVMDSVDGTQNPGEYKWAAQFRCTGVNGQAQVRNRGIHWSLGDESPATG